MAIYIAIYRLAALLEVSKQELGKANKETINLKKKLDTKVAEFVAKTSKVPASPSFKSSDTDFFLFLSFTT